MRFYGISLSQRNRILEEQSWLCKICGHSSKKFCVDHCHKLKKFRGIICDNCNKAIGHIRDDPKIAIKISEYLRKNNEQAN